MLNILAVAVLIGLMSLGRAGWRSPLGALVDGIGVGVLCYLLWWGLDEGPSLVPALSSCSMLPVLVLGLIELLQRIDGLRLDLSKVNERPFLRFIAAVAIVSLLVYIGFLFGLSLPLSFLVAGLLALLVRQLSSPTLQKHPLLLLLVQFFLGSFPGSRSKA